MIKDWIALTTAPGLGAQGIHNLLARHGNDAERALGAGEADWRSAGLGPRAIASLRQPDQAVVDATLAWLDIPGNHLLTLADNDYPPLLRDIPDCPAMLYVRGDPAQLWTAQIAIVGSRNPTAGGVQTTERFARGLVTAGLSITSGLALGIDGAAHRAALDAGGATVAVCGTGLDQVYPARHLDLAREIAEKGALISEFALGTPARAGNFPRRNRIISGLSLGTLVVEAALRSGSLITARLAAEQGREVFAIPGSIHNPMARGCHRLIRDGATLVEGGAEVVDAIAPRARELGQKIQARLDLADDAPAPGDAPGPARDPDYQRLLAAMGHDPVSVDYLVSATALTPDAVSSMLLLLELEGAVLPCPGGRYSLSPASAQESSR